MPRIVYGLDASPPVRAVLITAKTLGVDLELKDIKLDGDHMSDEFLKLNPQHTVPTINDNGFVIWDSHVIMTYLINKYAKGSPLYPEDPEKRAIVEQRLHFDNSVMFPALINTGKPIRMGLVQEVSDERRRIANEAYGFLEKFLEKSEWVAGSEPTIADISLVTTVTSLVYFFPLTDYPKIRAWVKKCETLPHFSINTDGVNSFNALFDKILKK